MGDVEDTRLFHKCHSDEGDTAKKQHDEVPKHRLVAIPDEEERPHDLELSDTLRKPDVVSKLLEEMHKRGEENEKLKETLRAYENTVQGQKLMLQQLELRLTTQTSSNSVAGSISDEDAEYTELVRDQIRACLDGEEKTKALVRIYNVGSRIVVDRTVRDKPIEYVKPPDRNDWYMAYGDGVDGVGLAKSRTQGDNAPTVESPRSPIMDFVIGIFLLGFIVSGGIALVELFFGPDGFNDKCKTWLTVSAFCFLFAGFIAFVTDETNLAQD